MASSPNINKGLVTILYGLIPDVKVILKKAENTQNLELFCLCNRLITKIQTSSSNRFGFIFYSLIDLN